MPWVKTLLLVSGSMKNTVIRLKRMSLLFKTEICENEGKATPLTRSFVWGGFEGGSRGQGWTDRRNLQMTKSLFGVLSTHFAWHRHTKQGKGQWDPDKSGQFHPCASVKASDPTYYPASQAGFVPCIQMQQPFPTAPAPAPGRSFQDTSFESPSAWHFHFIKRESMCFVCREEGMTRSAVVPTTACIGGSSSPRIIPLCAVKGYEKSVI